MGKEPTNSLDSRDNYRRLNKKTYSYIAIGLLIVFLIILFIPNMEYWDICFITYSLLFWIIIIPASICRLHDIGKSGLYILLGLIPICIIVMIIYLCTKEGTIENNEYAESENTPPRPSVTSKTTYTQLVSKVDINRSSKKDISKLYGLGPLQAKKIIKHRNQIGYYYNMNEFATDLNLDKHTIESLKDKLTFSKPTVNDNKDYNQKKIDH
ncbi:hypothetical protein SH1V18_33170 [Vallitalea longa]|uniref:Helix-hairpin-helix domain-containing protein n=1 Tax=Vallitalea longa TaxID=2936439 RepID=A0A9W5YC98_9FIRM|nr:DUF805 domain-containing protein [Vallitalea longa]GKX30837.1 hypothetical protein SH1V18_33170 [Vallitalea longa]